MAKKKKDEAEAEEVLAGENPTESQPQATETSPSQEDNLIQELSETIAKLTQEKAELQDLSIRKQADFENYRKRMSKEKIESIQYANADLIEKMLDVLDNFERAKKAAQENNDIQAVIQGIDLIENNLIALLNSKGLTKLKSLQEPFNPDHHLAIAMEESEETDEAHVIEEFQAGYLLHDRLLRTAKVKVRMPKAKE
ncbi:nucleotide exchange factor GrpE [Entomospira culicis]|uniref:Protein GrpE n=1 Tax=Entomospira culicis TaxID=2719989 RepID=A0A968GJ97_9SPIO|nr:nucleotide exchange factor GrpE [Entomospira culicis]NIZ19853.1 nucleotide exchange factor GrpE [Entomospira culicis]NIZ70067.1 nucleotide exchange factor GrpE [Entomospira culicis]WDI37171.1 nucleotide exchange factor GrpE [Entomospira culicis]WDI38800.1 nucleotide exchange factor GrpE [Entomospira culicis]